MVFWGEFLRRSDESFQLIYDHHQRSPTLSSLSEAMESPTNSLSSRPLAAMLQRQFDEEDHLLAAERAELLASAEQQHVFDCGFCMDTLLEESIARIEPCGHSFCRECVRGFIVSQIESRHFPVLCPTCTAEPDNNRPESIGSYVSSICFGVIINQANAGRARCYRGYAESITRDWYHAGAVRNMG